MPGRLFLVVLSSAHHKLFELSYLVLDIHWWTDLTLFIADNSSSRERNGGPVLKMLPQEKNDFTNAYDRKPRKFILKVVCGAERSTWNKPELKLPYLRASCLVQTAGEQQPLMVLQEQEQASISQYLAPVSPVLHTARGRGNVRADGTIVFRRRNHCRSSLCGS